MNETVVTSTKTTSSEETSYFVSYKTANFILLILESFLGLRFLLKATGANPGAGFVQFVYAVSEGLMLPFRFMFPQTSAGGSVIEWSIPVAMIVYALLFNGIVYIIDIMRTADTGNA